MGKVSLYKDSPSASTAVPNVFIEKHMTHADGEYVKIYLYLLRCLNRGDYEFSVVRFAEHFDHTEKDILRALKYWEKAGLVRLEYDGTGSLTGICVQTDHTDCGRQTAQSAPEDSKAEDEADAQGKSRFIQAASVRRRDYSPEELARFTKKSEIAELLFVAEQYLGRTLSSNDLSHIFSWYDQLHFSADFIEFLIESCVSRGHTGIYYIEKVAQDFASRGIRQIDQAKEAFDLSSALYRTVMKAFGIRGRSLGTSETDYITRWNVQLGFDAALIGEACRRTMEQIHEPSFRYADGILQNWYRQGISTMKEVEEADRTHRAEYASRKNSGKDRAKATGFSNYRERDNDYEELQRQLVLRSMQN